MISHDHTHHLMSLPNVCCMCTTVNKVFCQCSIFRAQTVQVVQVTVKNMLVLRWSQRAHCFFCGRPKGHVRAPPPQGTVPFGEGLARTLHLTCILLIGTLAIFLSPCTHSCLPQVQRLPMWWLCNAVKLVTICVLVINNQHMFRTIWEFVQSRDCAAHLEIA